MSEWKHADKSNQAVYRLRREGTVISLNSTEAVEIEGIGAVKQVVASQQCRGKRVQFKADISTKDVDGNGAGLWLTAAGRDWHLTDGMYDSLIMGTSDWQTFALAIDVPTDATYVSYGMWMGGHGESRMKNAQFQFVDDSVEVTSKKVLERDAVDRFIPRNGE